MKRFLLGTVFGATFGFVFSCMRDSDGNRPGKPLKVEFDALKHESNRFATALQNAKQASRELSEQLPAAQRTISDISDDVEKYLGLTTLGVIPIESKKSKQKKMILGK